MALDIQITVDDGSWTTKVLKIEEWEFRFDTSGAPQHVMKNIPFISDATGGQLPTWNVDFGDRTEQIILKGIISEGTPADNFEKFEELRRWFHLDCWRYKTYLKIGNLSGYSGYYHSEVHYTATQKGSTRGYQGVVANFRAREISGEQVIRWEMSFLLGIEFFK